VTGPAGTFTPINVWDVTANRGAEFDLDLPEGHNTMIVVTKGLVTVNGAVDAGEAEMVLLDRSGDRISLHASEDATFLVLTGEPIDEPIVGRGPFVMNSQEEIRQAYDDFKHGRFIKVA